MLYNLLWYPAQLAMRIYCRQVVVHQRDWLQQRGPLLLAANHPNSFLDAVILATLFKQPVYSLVRGDVYKKPFYAKLLSSLNMLPVYRISEGAGNLENNYDTFDKCRELFKENKIVLIFSEGRCINEWKLRPLKKGTARLATSSWEQDIALTVLPVSINYQSFTSFGKNIHLYFGEPISKNDFPNTIGNGQTINLFNTRLNAALHKTVYAFDSNDKESISEKFKIETPGYQKWLLLLPAALGFMAHAPLYIPVKKFAWRKTAHIDHYDSVMVGMLFLLYPFYLLLMIILLWVFTKSVWALALVAVLPFCAWAFVRLKKQF